MVSHRDTLPARLLDPSLEAVRGARNRITRELRTVLDKLEREEVIHPRQSFSRLEEIALSASPDHVAAADRPKRRAPSDP